jgi:hypothetical protein
VGARAVSVADAGDTGRAGGRRLVCLVRGALRDEARPAARGVECTAARRPDVRLRAVRACFSDGLGTARTLECCAVETAN